MSLKKIFAQESKRTQRLVRDVERSNRNWPIHREKVLEVLRELKAEAASHGQHFHLTEDQAYPSSIKDEGVFYGGAHIVGLQFLQSPTGITKTVQSGFGQRYFEHVMETGAELLIMFVPAKGTTQVFLCPPADPSSAKIKQNILINWTYNTDFLTRDRVVSLVDKLLTFNRVESTLLRASLLDEFKVRIWRYRDSRNRQQLEGYKNKLFNAWEVAILVVTWGVINIGWSVWNYLSASAK